MICKLTDEQIDELLHDNVLGHLGCNDGFNTYVYPTNYIYDGKFIICHSQAGSKIQVMRRNKRVCFQVDEIKNFTSWRSVMLLGEYQELNDERERYNAIKVFTDLLLRIKISETALLPGTKKQNSHLHWQGNIRPNIYRIVIDEKTGRYENDQR